MTADPYVDAIVAGALFADSTYQRDVDPKRVVAMADEFDRRLVGVLEVSDRRDGTYAILDGQHRHAAAWRAYGKDGEDDGPALVCQVYSDLSIEDEARLFHEINARRRALSWWDRWRARRAANDPKVVAIERVLTFHELQVNPAQAAGNIRATGALETIVDGLGAGDVGLLDSVLLIVTAAFGRPVDAFDGMVMQAIAYVLVAYDADEVDVNRLIFALTRIPPRQIRARAVSLREAQKGTLPRLCAAVIVNCFNSTSGPRVEPFLARLPQLAKADRSSLERRNARRHNTSPETGVSPRDEVASSSPLPAERDPDPTPAPTPPLPVSAPAVGICSCGHAARHHDDEDGEGQGVCLVCEDCAAFSQAVA